MKLGPFMEKIVQLKDSRTVIIREVQEPDVDGIWHNFNEVVNEGIYLPVYSLVTDDWEKEQWLNELNFKHNVCLVAEDKSHPGYRSIVGQLTLENSEWEAAQHVFTLGIIVQSGYRNSGLGHALIEASIEVARERGKKKIILSTFATNKMGIALYNSCGFKEIGRYSKQYLIQNEYIDEILMEYWIG